MMKYKQHKMSSLAYIVIYVPYTFKRHTYTSVVRTYNDIYIYIPHIVQQTRLITTGIPLYSTYSTTNTANHH